MTNRLLDFVLIALIALAIIVAVIIVTDSQTAKPVANVTYTDTNMMFQYPATYTNATPANGTIIAGSKTWETRQALSNKDGTVGINVYKSTLDASAWTTDQLAQISINSFKQIDNINLESTNRITNPQGVDVSILTATVPDPTDGKLLLTKTGFVIIDSTAYEIEVVGDNSSATEVQNTANIVYNSITPS